MIWNVAFSTLFENETNALLCYWFQGFKFHCYRNNQNVNHPSRHNSIRYLFVISQNSYFSYILCFKVNLFKKLHEEK